MSNITELLESSAYKTLSEDIDKFVKEKLKKYEPNITSSKTIHDPVWGSVQFSAWEMRIVDSPLFQRLRDIKQVGLAMLTYPAARHSRFEHSLGVASAVKLMCKKLIENSPEYKLSSNEENSIILAALLHDIGHCFFSHLSEKIYGNIKIFNEFRQKVTQHLELRPKPHELLSFIIINTPTFKNFFSRSIHYPDNITPDFFINIGQMIIGYTIEENNHLYQYKTALINGPFDADKLDYILRDSHSAGLSLQYDIERLLTKILIHVITNKNKNKIEYRLVIKISGVTAIETLTFCKIMLFSYVYYHQKVLISEAMIKDYIYGLVYLKSIKSISDFLRYTDSDILKLGNKYKNKVNYPNYPELHLCELAKNINDRQLPKRCFEISQSIVSSINTDSFSPEYIMDNLYLQLSSTMEDKTKFRDIITSFFAKITRSKDPVFNDIVHKFQIENYQEELKLREELYNEIIKEYKQQNKPITTNFNLFDIYIIFPNLVNYGASKEAIVLGQDFSQLKTVNDFIKLDDWAECFNSNKWRGYVFINAKIDKQLAFNACKKYILQGKLELKNPQAYIKNISE